MKFSTVQNKIKEQYKNYVKLYDSTPTKLLRSILKQAEDDDYKNEMSTPVIRNINKVIEYFNREKLHHKYTEEECKHRLSGRKQGADTKEHDQQ